MATMARALSTSRGKFTAGNRLFVGVLAGTVVVGGCGLVLCALDRASVRAMETRAPLPSYPWSFDRPLASFDHAAVRRGWTVYRNVCRSCHSLSRVRFLDLVNVSHAKEEVDRIAAEFEVDDGPDEQGNMFKRPARLNDTIPPPFSNEEAARVANGGAYPPDLTFAAYSTRGGADRLFSLLTGWMDPPAGMEPGDGQHFNVYFDGGVTSMPPMLFDGMLVYEDGTPATQSQMAKDVTEFLAWAGAPEHDSRKIMTIKLTGVSVILLAALVHLNRRNWSHIRCRRVAYVPNAFIGEPRCPASGRSERNGTLSNR